MGSLQLSFWAWVRLEDLLNQSSLYIRSLKVMAIFSRYTMETNIKFQTLTLDGYTNFVTHRTFESHLNGPLFPNVAKICQLPLAKS